MARNILPEIPVAEARTPLEPSSNVAGGLLQVAGAALDGIKQVSRIKGEQAEIDYRVAKAEKEEREKQQAAAKAQLEERMRSFGIAEGERVSDRITAEALTILSEDEERISKLTTDSAMRLKRKHDQGLLTEEAMGIELEIEMRRLRASTGGAYGDIIAKGFADVVGFDPSGSRIKQVNKLLKKREEEADTDPVMKGLTEFWGQAMANRIVQWSMDNNISIGAAEKAIASQESALMRYNQEKVGVDRQNLKGEELLNATISLAQKSVRVELTSLRTSGVIAQLEDALRRGERIDPSLVKAKILQTKQAVYDRVMSQSSTMLKGGAIPATLDTEVSQAIDIGFSNLERMADQLDKFKSSEDTLKYIKTIAELGAYEHDPWLLMGSMFPPEVQTQMLIKRDEALENWNIGTVYNSMKPKLAVLITAEANGLPELRGLREQFPDAAEAVEKLQQETGKSAQEIFDEQVHPALLTNVVANQITKPETRVDSLKQLQEVSPRHVITLMGDPKNFNGIANNQEAKVLVQMSMADMIAGYSSVARAMEISLPTESFESDFVAIRQKRLDQSKMNETMTLGEAVIMGRVKFKAVGNDVVLSLPDGITGKIGAKNAQRKERHYQETLVPTYLKDMVKAINLNSRSGLLKGTDIDSPEKVAEYLNMSFANSFQNRQQPEPETEMLAPEDIVSPATQGDTGYDWTEKDFGGVIVKKVKQ
jgi:hypothetical protein